MSLQIAITEEQLSKIAFLVARSNARNRSYHTQGAKALAAEMACFKNGILAVVDELGLKLDMAAAEKLVSDGDTRFGWV